MKISIIGAGSFFTLNIVSDILNIEGLDQVELSLVDIDTGRLNNSRLMVEQLAIQKHKQVKIAVSQEIDQCVANSDFIINQIEVHGLDTVLSEFEIPLKYGVKQCIGDTMGPGGLFKSLRTLPTWMEMVKRIEVLAPDCLILNYTNPMSAVTLLTSRITNLPVVGLCHSVQGTVDDLARYAQVPVSEVCWKTGGINHMSWITEFAHKGQDLFPVILDKAKQDPAFLESDHVRLDMLKYFGAFVTESSGHQSEYNPYYRKNDALLNQYCHAGYNGETGFYAHNWPVWRQKTQEDMLAIISGTKDMTAHESCEYAAVVIEGIYKNKPQIFYGNVPNSGLITNLPLTGVVEVACVADGTGIHPLHYGALPEHLAALCRSNMAFFEMVVQSVLEKDRQKALQALMLDPLTAAVCSLEQISQMFEELYQAEKSYISI